MLTQDQLIPFISSLPNSAALPSSAGCAVKYGMDMRCVSAATSNGKTGWFEGEMLDVQRKLPPGTFMKACINCAFSDYSPYGHGLFGYMICFRANKASYLALPSGENFEKDAYFDVISTVSEMVQETYLCPEFGPRVPETGYRGRSSGSRRNGK